jgi:CRISPR-associated protein Csx14
MAEAFIPVDLFNPGQVFACLGFLEAADLLLGDAEAGFNWIDEENVCFLLRAAGNQNPFVGVLKFLADAEVHACAPIGYTNPPRKKARSEDENQANSAASDDLIFSESFPNHSVEQMALPIRLESSERPLLDLDHWADGSCRNEFKLYAGNRSAYDIACAMLHGTREKPNKKERHGKVKTQGIAALWNREPEALTANPLDVLTPMGGSFNFDPRGAWTALDAGYSPNQHSHHGIAASPVLEILAAWGLEHARPHEYEPRRVRYGAWGGLLPPILARPSLSGASVAFPLRTFRFVLDLSGKNKVVTFAQEETNT